MPDAPPALRADKFLHNVRIFKTRALAARACGNGQVTLSGQAVKSSRDLRAGDVLEIERGDLRLRIRVLAFPNQRIGAPRVPEFYENLTPSEWFQRAAALRQERQLQQPHPHELAAKPNKKQLRQLREWREGRIDEG